MSTALDTMRLIRDSSLKANERLVLLTMTLRADSATADGMWASQGRLADETGLSLTAVKSAMKALEARGVLARTGERQSRKGGKPVVQYRIDREVLAAAARPVVDPQGENAIPKAPQWASDDYSQWASGGYELPTTTAQTFAPNAHADACMSEELLLLTANAVNPGDGRTSVPKSSHKEETLGQKSRGSVHDDHHKHELRALLHEYLVEAADDENITLPYEYMAPTQDDQIAWIISDLEADLQVDQPLTYLLAIYRNDGAYQFGLAVKEKWNQVSAWRRRQRSA